MENAVKINTASASRESESRGGGFILPVATLARRELVRFFRQRNRVVGALLQPLIFWVLFGAAFKPSFKNDALNGMTYQEYFFPGTIVMILLFTAIFSTISIIEDRKEGFLQSVLVAPISRLAMVLGKILGGTILAVIQGSFFLVIALCMNYIQFDALLIVEAIGMMVLIAFALTGLGFLIAWRMDSTQGFHAIMSVFLLPMWLLSGSLFPPEGTSPWLYWMITLNPLTYGLAAFRHILYGAHAPATLPSFGLSMAVTLAFAGVMAVACAWIAGTRAAGDLH